MTSPDALFIFFSKFWFSGLLGGMGGWDKGQQKAQNDQTKFFHSVSQELYLIWLWFLVHKCKMMTSPAISFHFFKILIFQVFESSSINAKRKFWGVSHLLHICVIFIKFSWKIDYNLVKLREFFLKMCNTYWIWNWSINY